MRVLALAFVLTLGLGLPATGAARARKATTPRPPRHGPVTLFHVNHRETISYRPYDAKGRLRPAELKRFNRFMRDGRNRVGRMHPRLATLFYRVAQHYGGKRVEVISGYRPDATNPRSPHRKGLAVDFRVQGVANAELRDYLRRGYQKVGVGYYPNSVFVHFDVRQRSAFWIDYSGPGEAAVYASDPDGDSKSGRADTYKPSRDTPPATQGDAESGQAGEDAPPPGQESPEPPRRAEPPPDEEAPPVPPADDPATAAKPGVRGAVQRNDAMAPAVRPGPPASAPALVPKTPR